MTPSDVISLEAYIMFMTANNHFADVMQLEQVLAHCSKMCRNLSSSSAIDIAKDHALPDLPRLVRLVNDCAASCDIAILLIERKSHIVMDFLQICEELTMACAWECSNYGLEPYRLCAEACEKAAKACLPHVIHRQAV